jgi:hypothetical protein
VLALAIAGSLAGARVQARTRGHPGYGRPDVRRLPGRGKSLTIDFPCAGYVCDNLDPTASFSSATGAYCSVGGTTVTSISADSGTLEMRWGGNCQVNWARFTPASSGTFYCIWAGRQSPGFNAYGYELNGTAGVQYFSNRVYAPGAAHVCVEEWNGSSWVNQVCTNWI